MSGILSTGSYLNAVANLSGFDNERTMWHEVKMNLPEKHLIFLAYLSGERTAHNNPNAKGIFCSLTLRARSVGIMDRVVYSKMAI